jgi:hypothetical protein
MTVSGAVEDIKGDRIFLKVLPGTITFDVGVAMTSRAGLRWTLFVGPRGVEIKV